MKLTFTNWFGKPDEQKNKQNLQPSDTIDVQDCTITYYDSDTTANQNGALKVVVNGQKTTINEASCFDVESVIELNETKHNIFKRLALQDGNAGNLTEEDLRKADENFKEGCKLWQLGVVDIVYSPETHLAVVKIKGNQVLKFNFNNLSEVTLSKDELNDAEEEIFNLYNTDKSWGNKKILNENELTQMLEEIMPHCTEKDGTINPKKMYDFIKTKGFENVQVSDLKRILDKVMVKGKALSIYNSDEKRLDGVTSDNIAIILSEYSNIDRGFLKNVFGSKPSLIKDICNSNDKEQIDKLKNCITERAQIFLSEEEINNFQSQINGNISNKDLANIITKFISEPSYKEREKLYENNKNSIINIMSNKDICYINKDFTKIANKIIKYANMYNPRDIVEKYAESKNSEISNLAQSLLDSNYLDYFPVFVATIISHESQFKERDGVYGGNGKGILQLTTAACDDVFTNSKTFNKNFVSKIKTKYKDSQSFTKAINDSQNIELNYETGINVLNSKLSYIFYRLNRDATLEHNRGKTLKYPVILNNPAKILETIALDYNGNKAEKRDSVYNGALSQLQYVYARDVIERFITYTPENLEFDSYYELDPNNKKIINKHP